MAQQNPMLEAIRAYMTRAALPIIADRGGQVKTGTGTIFRAGDRYFIVTAGHVLDNDDLAHASSPHGRRNATIKTWGDINVLSYKSDYDLDLSVVELKTEETIVALAQAYNVLTLDQVGLPSADGHFWLVGFPSDLTAADRESINQTPFSFLTKMLSKTPDLPSNARAADPRVDLFFQLDREGTQGDGSAVQVPYLEGVSGASIWEVSDYQGPVWAPGKALKVVGVQKAAMHGRYIRATRWELVAPLLYHLEQQP